MLSKQRKRELAAKAHSLKPVVLFGSKGLTEAILAEIDVALNAHELIKIRLGAGDKETKQAITEQICKETGAEFIQAIGHILTIYRQRPEKN